MEEIWKDIYYYDFIKSEWIDYRGLYQISNKGRVKSLLNENSRNQHKEEKIRKHVKRGNYFRIRLCKNGKGKNFAIHRLVAFMFIPNPLNKTQVNHIDENTFNNNASNLEWCTPSENTNHGTRNERVSEKLSIAVVGVNIKDGSIIRFDGTRKAKGFDSSKISQCCKGKRKTHKGYKWYYEKDYLSTATLSEAELETIGTCND